MKRCAYPPLLRTVSSIWTTYAIVQGNSAGYLYAPSYTRTHLGSKTTPLNRKLAQECRNIGDHVCVAWSIQRARRTTSKDVVNTMTARRTTSKDVVNPKGEEDDEQRRAWSIQKARRTTSKDVVNTMTASSLGGATNSASRWVRILT